MVVVRVRGFHTIGRYRQGTVDTVHSHDINISKFIKFVIFTICTTTNNIGGKVYTGTRTVLLSIWTHFTTDITIHITVDTINRIINIIIAIVRTITRDEFW